MTTSGGSLAGFEPPPLVERRRVQRVRMLNPLRAAAGDVRVFIVDASLRGLRIAHQEKIGGLGDLIVVSFAWEGRPITVRCNIVRSQVRRAADSPSGRPLHHTGVTIAQVISGAAALRELIESHVERALDEQKANARGVPAISPQSIQTGRATHFVRHELVLGNWRETATTEAVQPEHGFTVSAEHSPREVQMLRSAFERGGANVDRELIRRLAQLSIGSREGIPTRRFMP